MYYAIVDCDNCYVSCERVFRPDLQRKPVVVLSNNDGCVVARSNEVKALGVKAGMPFFKVRQLLHENDVAVFSSNYELYGELTSRVVSIIQQESPSFYRYSIDECFVFLDDMPFSQLQQWGIRLHQRILKSVGMPVSIGISTNKSLAKIASHFAKKHHGYRHCCVIDSDEKRLKALRLFPISEVWGIGRKTLSRIESRGIHTAFDLANSSPEWVQSEFRNINIFRIWLELNRIDSIPNESASEKKTITSSRSFGKMVSDLKTLRAYATNHAVGCAEKLRAQHSVASQISLFLYTNFHREDLPQDANVRTIQFFTPTSSTIEIVNSAISCLCDAYKTGFLYKKLGVTLSGIMPSSALQTNFLDYDSEGYEKRKRLDEAVDHINNDIYGARVMMPEQQEGSGEECSKHFLDTSTRHEFRSKNPTTRWADIIRLK